MKGKKSRKRRPVQGEATTTAQEEQGGLKSGDRSEGDKEHNQINIIRSRHQGGNNMLGTVARRVV